MQGRIKLYRKAQNNCIASSLELFGLFNYFLLKANHQQSTIYIGSNKIDINAGEFVRSMQGIAEHFSVSKPKAYRLVEALCKEGIVKRKGYSKYTLFTLVNWHLYQSEGNANVTANVTPNETQTYTNKNDKNEKNEKNEKNLSLSKDNEPSKNLDGYGNENINRVINTMKQACDKVGLQYMPGYKERIYAKHIISTKFADSISKYNMPLEVFINNIITMSARPYMKQVNTPQLFYMNRGHVINASISRSSSETTIAFI